MDTENTRADAAIYGVPCHGILGVRLKRTPPSPSLKEDPQFVLAGYLIDAPVLIHHDPQKPLDMPPITDGHTSFVTRNPKLLATRSLLNLIPPSSNILLLIARQQEKWTELGFIVTRHAIPDHAQSRQQVIDPPTELARVFTRLIQQTEANSCTCVRPAMENELLFEMRNHAAKLRLALGLKPDVAQKVFDEINQMEEHQAIRASLKLNELLNYAGAFD